MSSRIIIVDVGNRLSSVTRQLARSLIEYNTGVPVDILTDPPSPTTDWDEALRELHSATAEVVPLNPEEPEDTDPEVKRFKAFDEKYYSVSVQRLDRRYGGPEEGGWWYDTGAPVEFDLLSIGLPFEFAMPQFFRTPEEASIYSNSLNDFINMKIKQRDLSSVLGDGRVEAIVQLGLPHAWSNYRPYE